MELEQAVEISRPKTSMSSPPAKRVKLDEPEAVVIPDVKPVEDSKPDAASLDALKARYPCLTDSLNAPHITESSVGISQYVDAAVPAFSAIIKHRFTDFLVNEVNLAGKVIELKSIQRPPAEEVEQGPVEEKPADSLTADGSLVGLLLLVMSAWPTFCAFASHLSF